MRKQALIHCHGLVAEIAEHCIEEEIPLDLDEYRSHGIRPTSIHRSKGEHQDAVFTLVDSISSALTEADETAEPAAVRAD